LAVVVRIEAPAYAPGPAEAGPYVCAGSLVCDVGAGFSRPAGGPQGPRLPFRAQVSGGEFRI
jgi:hypothetical protein